MQSSLIQQATKCDCSQLGGGQAYIKPLVYASKETAGVKQHVVGHAKCQCILVLVASSGLVEATHTAGTGTSLIFDALLNSFMPSCQGGCMAKQELVLLLVRCKPRPKTLLTSLRLVQCSRLRARQLFGQKRCGIQVCKCTVIVALMRPSSSSRHACDILTHKQQDVCATVYPMQAIQLHHIIGVRGQTSCQQYIMTAGLPEHSKDTDLDSPKRCNHVWTCHDSWHEHDHQHERSITSMHTAVTITHESSGACSETVTDSWFH